MKASKIADILGEDLHGNDIDIHGACSNKGIRKNHVYFENDSNPSLMEGALCLCKRVYGNHSATTDEHRATWIECDNPRLAHAQVVFCFFNDKHANETYEITNFPGTTIYRNVFWGEGVWIKPGAVIGASGFGFEWGDDKIPFRRPHIGGVEIGDFVEIGANSCVSRGTIDDTVIGNHVKIDDLCHIAHNCKIGARTMIAAGAVIGGSVEIGEDCWIGINCSILQKLKIGNAVTIGAGAIITKDVPDGARIAGFKGQPIDTMKRMAEYVEGKF